MASPSSRNIVVVLAVVAALGCLGASGLVWLGARTLASDFGGDGTWGPATVPLATDFAVEAVPAPLAARERMSGFQDARWEILLHYREPDARAVISRNKFKVLTVKASLPTDERDEILRAWHVGVSNAFMVSGLENIERDGGVVELYRSLMWVDLEDGTVVLFLDVGET